MIFKEKPQFKSLWEGNLLLNNIEWIRSPSLEFLLPKNHDISIKELWKNHLKEFPNDYDGKLLFLFDFYFKDEILYLEVGIIQFSTVIYMVSNKIKPVSGIGMLGVQCIILSPDNKYILVGNRSNKNIYYPRYMTIPGGMLENHDLNRNPKEALLREIYEEVGISLCKDIFLISILKGWNEVSVTFLLRAKVKKNNDFSPDKTILAEKDEWENNLNWISLKKLKKLSNKQLLDGLIYYQSKL